MKPNRQATVRKFRVGKEPCERECRLTRTPAVRVIETLHVGADQTPVVREVTGTHRRGEKGRRGP